MIAAVSQVVTLEAVGAHIDAASWVLDDARKQGAISLEQWAVMREALDVTADAFARLSGFSPSEATARRNERLIEGG